MTPLPIRRIVLYKHGVGYFEREGTVEGQAALSLTFKQNEVSDVLKSLTVLDLGGGHISSVSYDSTKPLEQLLAEVALHVPDRDSLVSLLPQIKGARVALHTGVSDPVEGGILGIDTAERQTGDGVVKVVLISVVTDSGAVRSFDLHNLASLQILDEALRRDLDFYLRTRLSATKKDARTFTFFAEGEGQRTIRLSYTLEAPVWKATYRIILGEGEEPATIQGWAVVDNVQDEDWEDVQLSLISGLPVSFVHDLYTPRYIRRPEVRVKDTTGVLPPEVEEGYEEMTESVTSFMQGPAAAPVGAPPAGAKGRFAPAERVSVSREKIHAFSADDLQRSVPTQVREQAIGDLLEYQIEHPVTIRRNQSALVPIVLREFDGKPVLLYNKNNRTANPMSAVLFKNTTGLTLEGGPVTVLQQGSYVGEAMLETMKPDEKRLVPYAVELSISATDSIKSHRDKVQRVVIRDGMMTTFFAEVVATTYTFKNKSDKEYTLYLEHPRKPDGYAHDPREWELVDSHEPNETTENFWRYKLQMPGKKTSTFHIAQQLILQQTHSLADVTLKTLEYWLVQRYFDENTAKVLREVVKHREAEARQAELVHQLEKEKKDLFTAQQRIRENLLSLGDRASEKQLRERYVKNLQKQEDRLDEIEGEIKERQEAISRYREKIKELLSKLHYETAVGKK